MFKMFFRSSDYPTQSPTNLTIPLSPPLRLTDDYEVAISGGSIVNVAANLSAALNNNTVRYSTNGGGSWKTVTFPNGSYQCTALNTELQYAMTANGDYTIVNDVQVFPIQFLATLYLDRVQIQLAVNTELDLSIGNFASLLGFTPQILSAGGSQQLFTASGAAGFTDSSLNYFIYTDVINGGLNLGSQFTNGILIAVAGGDAGLAVSLKQSNGIYDYYPLTSRNIDFIRLVVYNNLLQVADLLGEDTGFELTFQPLSWNKYQRG
jgi:hypothetical protein